MEASKISSWLAWPSVIRKNVRKSFDLFSCNSQYKSDSLAYLQSIEDEDSEVILKSVTDTLVASNSVKFASISLVCRHRGSFGLATVKGAGANLFPPVISSSITSAPNVTKVVSLNNQGVYAIADSNFSIEHVLHSHSPLLFDCSLRDVELPKDIAWLHAAGLKSALALPILHRGDVHGMLLVGLSQRSVTSSFLVKMEQVATKIAPAVVECVSDLIPILAKRRPARFETDNEVATAVLEELVNLDAVLLSKLDSMERNAPLPGARTRTPARPNSLQLIPPAPYGKREITCRAPNSEPCRFKLPVGAPPTIEGYPRQSAAVGCAAAAAGIVAPRIVLPESIPIVSKLYASAAPSYSSSGNAMSGQALKNIRDRVAESRDGHERISVDDQDYSSNDGSSVFSSPNLCMHVTSPFAPHEPRGKQMLNSYLLVPNSS